MKIFLFVSFLMTSALSADASATFTELRKMTNGWQPTIPISNHPFKIDRVCSEHLGTEECYFGRCENGGVSCQRRTMCNCLKGTGGHCCSKVRACKKDDFCGTDGTAKCEYNTYLKEAVCNCRSRDTLFDYREKVCRKPCRKNDSCANGGKCTRHGRFKFCECLPGTEGNFCSQITECKENYFCGTSNGTACTYDSTQMQVICNCLDSSKQFDYNEKICKAPCENDSNCENGHKCIGDEASKFCQCIPGENINFCSHITDCDEPDSCGIGNDVTCEYNTAQLKARCRCSNASMQFDYREKICREPCQDSDCENAGKCTGHGDFKFCECLPGTTGNLCSEVTDCNESDFCGTGNDTTCIYNSTQIEAMCQCLNSSTQFDYQEKVCREPCQEGDCENGANCTLSDDFTFCECLLGTSGDFCSEVIDCKDNFCGTQNDSICIYDSYRMEAMCQCSNRSKEFNYKEKICKKPCQESDCENGGNCTGYGDFKFCECLPGTRGDHCSEITKCEEKDFCGADAKCTYDSFRMEAICRCSNRSKQFDYKEKICRAPCGAEKCENGGICNGTRDLKFCECLLGTTGDFCTEISVCREEFICGYGSDVRCVYDQIMQKAACKCSNSNTDFNYLTKTCECDCGRNGTCVLDVFGEKKCSCNEGFAEFSGWCEECSCGSGENCSFDSYGRKMCTCSTGFRNLNGNCEKILLGESTFPALIGSLLAFLIIAFSGFIYLRWRKQKTGTAFHFKTLMESFDVEYERSVHLI